MCSCGLLFRTVLCQLLFFLGISFISSGEKSSLLSLLAGAFSEVWIVGSAVNLHLLVLGESFTWINLMLALSHFGMVAEGVIYYPFNGTSFKEIISVSGIIVFRILWIMSLAYTLIYSIWPVYFCFTYGSCFKRGNYRIIWYCYRWGR